MSPQSPPELGSARATPPISPSAASSARSRWTARGAPPLFGKLLTPIAVVALAIALGYSGSRAVQPSIAEAPSGFVDDRSCGGCHRAEYERWSGSHHARAMQRADRKTVLGNFGDARLVRHGKTSRFFTRDGAFFVNTEGPDGAVADFRIEYTFGVAPLQQYLVALPGGRLQALTTAWDVKRRRWFSLDLTGTSPGDPLHWTGRYQNWNLMCAECHVTDLRKGYDVATDSYQTTWAAPNVGCQACHGPGGAHVGWAAAGAARSDPGFALRGASGSSRTEVDACARCHSRRVRLTDREHPGRPLLDEWNPDVLRGGLYHPDGQQLGEVYEYGSFRQSAMYARGVRCSDCHEPHAGTLRADGNGLCTRCHGPRPDPRFATLRPRDYDRPAHHFHRTGSPGARCVSCHMPARTYMLVDPRRDHSFQVPRPDLTQKLGVPNACTSCHTKRGAAWATDAIRRWYGPEALQTQHFAQVIAAGRASARGAGPRLRALATDASVPAVVRATALELLRGFRADALAAASMATTDDDPVVRAAALRALDSATAADRVRAAAPLLRDPVRAVRIEAANVLASVPRERLEGSDGEAFDAAVTELIAAALAMADMPSAHVNLGVVYERLGRPEQARQSYATALRLDPTLVAARVNLAALLDGMGRAEESVRTLRDGLAAAPESGELHYALGLVLAESGRAADAADEFQIAARLLPPRARLEYNRGITLAELGRTSRAEAALRRATALDPTDPEIVYALAAVYLRQGRYDLAALHARRLDALAPGHAGAKAILDRVNASARRPAKRLPQGTSPAILDPKGTRE